MNLAQPQRRFRSMAIAVAHLFVFTAALSPVAYALLAGLCILLDHAESGPAAAAFAPLTQRWFDSLWNSAILVTVAATVALGGGTLLGYLLARTRARLLENLLIAIACVPYAALITFILAPIHFWLLYGSLLLCGVAHGLVFLPLAALGLGRAFASVDRDLTDAARLDAGDGPLLRRVLIPSAMWAYVALGAYLALFVLTDYSISDLFRIRTFAEEIYLQYALDTSLGRAALTGLPVLVLGIPLLLAALRYLRHHGTWDASAVAEFSAPTNRPSTIAQRRRAPQGTSPHFIPGNPPPAVRWAARAASSIILLTALAIVAVVAARLDSPADFLTRTASMRDELLNTAIVSIASVACLLAVAVGFAWMFLRTRRGRFAILAGVTLILATPAPVIAIALISLLNRPGLPGLIYDSPAAMILGLFVRFLPFAILLLAPAVQRIPRTLEESMKLDGATWFDAQVHLFWPNLVRDLAFCALVLLVATFGEIACTMLLVPPGFPTVPVRAYSLLHFGVYQDLAALALASTASILAIVFAARLILRRR